MNREELKELLAMVHKRKYANEKQRIEKVALCVSEILDIVEDLEEKLEEHLTPKKRGRPRKVIDE